MPETLSSRVILDNLTVWTALLLAAATVGTFHVLPYKALASGEGDPSWAQIFKAGTDALDAGSYGRAERLLVKAVIQSAAFGEGDARFAKSLGELGRYYTIRGRFQDAEPLLEEQLHNIRLGLENDTTKEPEGDPNAQEGGSDERGELIQALGSMISFYLEHGTAAKAHPLTAELLALVEGKLVEYRQAANGPVKLQKGVPLSGWAGMATASMQAPAIEWAITCDAIGTAYRLRGSYVLSERLYKAALEIKETVLGKQHLSLANSYDNLGMICQERNDDAEAESFFRYALEHTERILPAQNPQVFARLDKLARCLIRQKKYEEAEKLYLRAKDFWKAKPANDGTEARALYALGSLYVDERKHAEAAPVLKRALHLAESCYGPDSISLVPYLKTYAAVMYYLGQNQERSELVSRANTISGVASQ